MRFAFLHHGDPVSEGLWSGIPLNIVRKLRELGHEVVLVGGLHPQVPFSSRVKSAFYRFLLKKVYTLNRDPTVIRSRAADGNRRLSELGPVDAVLITFVPDAAFLETKSPVVIVHDATWNQLLDYYPGYERNRLAAEIVRGGVELDGKALDRCDHAIYSSNWAAAGAIQEFGISPQKVSIASLGANLTNQPTREQVASFVLRRNSGSMKLLFVGKEWYRKGADIAVRVAAEIERLGHAVELHVVGCNPEGEVPPFVRAHGFLSKDVPGEIARLRGLYESSDFFIMPTRADATPIVYAEAAAYGLPVMATDTGGVREVVQGEWSIALPLEASPKLYAEWAVMLFLDRQEYERLCWLARDSFENRLNWGVFCGHLTRVVADLAK